MVVVLIDDAIRSGIRSVGLLWSAHILIDEHTGLHLILAHTKITGDAEAVEVFVDFLITAEHAQALQAPEADIGALVALHLTVDVLCSPVDVEHLVVAIARVDTDLVLPVLADLVLPVERKFDTIVIHLAYVESSSLGTDDGRNRLVEVKQHLAVPGIVSIDVDAKTVVERIEVDTDIALIGLIPMDVTVHSRVVLVDGDAVEGLLAGA